MMTSLSTVPEEVLATILVAFLEGDDSEFVDYDVYRDDDDNDEQRHGIVKDFYCRIEAVRALLRLRLVCRRWRDAIQSDQVARFAFGPCEILGERDPSPTSAATRSYASDLADSDGPVAAWHSKLDSEPLADLWEWHVDDISPDPLAPLQRKSVYRTPAVRHWRCGRVTSGVRDEFVVATATNRSGSGVLRHVGDCAPPGGWFSMLPRRDMGGNLLDDGEYAYWEPRAAMPVMFSNQCGVVLERLRRVAVAEHPDDVFDREVFDLATAAAYVKQYPLKLEQLQSLPALFDTEPMCRLEGSRQYRNLYSPASKLCFNSCSFCKGPLADSYFDWNLKNRDIPQKVRAAWFEQLREGGETAEVYDGRWLLQRLVRHCTVRSAQPPLLFAVWDESDLNHFPHHAYALVVDRKTGRLMGSFTWFRLHW
ncbi:hypothetical protein DFJ73DRAFT_840066 [Zopfochytrium polystomum]|nr:hypothetical protein DFJ73DRAFT_840066 [Zopfochytrium polystomum]